LTRQRLRIVWIVYWVALFAVMHTPKPEGVHLPAGHLDKIFHFGGYAVLAGLCAMNARRSGRQLTLKWFVAWTLILSAYAAIDELLQPLVNRDADLLDWLANVAGVLAAFSVIGRRAPAR
jgi:VanZ family protein